MAMPIRVLQVVGILNCGGAESMIMNLYRNVDREQVQFDFVVHSDEEGMYDTEVKALGGEIYHCPKFRIKNLKVYCKWWKKFFETHTEYRIIHSHVRSCAAVYFSIAKKYGVKTIIHSHSTSNGEGVSAAVKNIMQFPLRYQADCMMACSQKAGEWLYGKNACKSKRYTFLPNAVDVDKYQPNVNTREQYRTELNLENNVVYGHVGRFHESKNHPFLLEVFAQIHEKNKNARLLLIGDGELREMVEKKIKELDIQDSVILLGLRRDIAELLQAIDVLLFPSVWEGLPVTVIEAQAAGVPCIISDNITTDVDITDLVTRLPITNVENWVETAMSELERKNVCKAVKKSGFDVKESALLLTKIYEKMIEK